MRAVSLTEPAKWIWSQDEGKGSNEWRWFRAEFTWPADATSAELLITAETRYRVWMNGVIIGHGPDGCVPWRQLLDAYDITGMVEPGTAACVAVLVNSLGTFPAQTRGGLLVAVRAQSRVICASDESWRVGIADAYASDQPRTGTNRVRPYNVVEDRRRKPHGWALPGFDDSGWSVASPISEPDPQSAKHALPWTRLELETLPRSTEVFAPVAVTHAEECLAVAPRSHPFHLQSTLSQTGSPIRHTQIGGTDSFPSRGPISMRCATLPYEGTYEPVVTLDFGTIRCARLEIEVSGPTGGVVEVGFAERLIDGCFTLAFECGFAQRFILTGRRETLTCWHWQSFRYVRLRVQDSLTDVVLHRILARDETYALEDQGSFIGPTDLMAVERISRATLRLCAIDGLIDSPWRESAAWLGDGAAVAAGGLLACFGGGAVTEAFLRRAAACQLPSGLIAGVINTPELRPGQAFADYSLWWLLALWKQYLWTGNEALIHDHYGHAVRLMEHFDVGNDGLLGSSNDPVFIDWSPIRRTGTLAYLNALFAEALRVLAGMADLIGDTRRASRARSDRDHLKESFAGTFIDRDRSIVTDLPRHLGEPTVSETANAAAILFDMLNPRDARRAIATLWREHEVAAVEAEPFGTAIVLRALAHAGEIGLAVAMIRDRWGRRMVERGATTTYEEWSPNGSRRSGRFAGFLRSQSHAWSAAPAEFFIWAMPGLEIVEPGCRRLRFTTKNPVIDFDIVCPTPLGPVRIQARQGEMQIDAPPTIQVDPPVQALSTRIGESH